jgi:hypothetical protein
MIVVGYAIGVSVALLTRPGLEEASRKPFSVVAFRA